MKNALKIRNFHAYRIKGEGELHATGNAVFVFRPRSRIERPRSFAWGWGMKARTLELQKGNAGRCKLTRDELREFPVAVTRIEAEGGEREHSALRNHDNEDETRRRVPVEAWGNIAAYKNVRVGRAGERAGGTGYEMKWTCFGGSHRRNLKSNNLPLKTEVYKGQIKAIA